MFLIQIVAFLFLLALLYLPFKIFKISDKTRYLVYLVICIGLFIVIMLDPVMDKKLPIVGGILLAIAGIVRKLKVQEK